MSTTTPADDAVAAGVPTLAPTTQAPPTTERPRRGIGVFELAAVSAVVAIGAVATYHALVLPRSLPRLAAVDLAAIYREQEEAFTRVITQEGVTDSERERAISRAEAFARGLPAALEELSQECACALLASNAVAGHHGVLDLTDALRRKVGS